MNFERVPEGFYKYKGVFKYNEVTFDDFVWARSPGLPHLVVTLYRENHSLLSVNLDAYHVGALHLMCGRIFPKSLIDFMKSSLLATAGTPMVQTYDESDVASLPSDP